MIKARFDRVLPFSQGVAAVEVDGLWGFINGQGEFVIPLSFKSADSFSQGLAAVQSSDNSLWGYINHAGTYKVAPMYSVAERFESGLARVAKGTMNPLVAQWYLIDDTGAVVWTEP